MIADTVRVPRLGSATQSVKFHLRNLSLVRTLDELSRTSLLVYELDGTVYVRPAAGARERSVRVERRGELDLNRIGSQ